ncbi:hypothetical protein [Spirillospora sp. CA-128828]|uniref:hypothetical protein n=1 Tax=Spirillospora sp. CA-128828 TaxID=3240033 RepID=UPI003D930E88
MRRPYRGLAEVTPVLRILLEVMEGFRYSDDLDPSAAIRALVFTARVGDTAVKGVDLVRFGESGLVVDLTVTVWPLPAVVKLARAVDEVIDQASPLL